MNIAVLNVPTVTAKAVSQTQRSSQKAELKTTVSDYQLNSSAPSIALTYAAEGSEEYKASYEKSMKHQTGPFLKADDSIRTIEDRLKKFQKALELSRPDLAKSTWDVTIKDGELKVTGDISSDDKKLMEARLNKDQALVSAVKNYMTAASDHLETGGLNTAYSGQNEYTGSRMIYNFKDVAIQLNGKVNFKELISTSWKMYDNPNGEATDPGRYRGASSLDILASRLTSLPL